MKLKNYAVGGSALLSILLLWGCAATDVVGKVAQSSFEEVLSASDGRVGYSPESSSWRLSSPAGDEFYFSSDFSLDTSGKSAALDTPDLRFEFDAAPFLNAGLDPPKLPVNKNMAYRLSGGRLILQFEAGSEKFASAARDSAAKGFAEIIKAKRDRIGYHEQFDHYGIELGGGNMFEWAKDMTKNDKDIVFVLNPEPFVMAGTDPSKIDGWVFGKVTVRDAKNQQIQVEKLLKPFNLK